MIFTTWPFVVFMSLVFILYWWIVPSRFRREFLLFASLGYFAYNFLPYALLLGVLTIIVYYIGILIFRFKEGISGASAAKGALITGLVLSTGTLAFFKYSRMLVETFNSASRFLESSIRYPLPHIMVPLGISFFTFEFIHYLTDLYHGRVERVRLRDFALFAFFFPSLVSGPIKRFQIFQDQSEHLGNLQANYVKDGFIRIVYGIAKKLIIADTASLFTTPLLDPHLCSRMQLWVAMYAYAVKIYYDFSGYTDIAIGCAQLLGYRLPENFNKPYRAPNISIFWNHWHMSLSSWVRDYLFIPLGGSRVPPWRVLFNLTVVMAICGLWHGANWTFIVWGLWHGLGLALLRVYQLSIGKKVPDSMPVRWLSTAICLQFVCFGWVFFASPSMAEAMYTFRHLL